MINIVQCYLQKEVFFKYRDKIIGVFSFEERSFHMNKTVVIHAAEVKAAKMRHLVFVSVPNSHTAASGGRKKVLASRRQKSGLYKVARIHCSFIRCYSISVFYGYLRLYFNCWWHAAFSIFLLFFKF